MTLQNDNKISEFDYLILLPIMALAFYIAFIPHLNYPYPLHVDEWIHLVNSKELMQAGSITFPGSFLLEAGFHTFLGIFQRISGIPWIDIFRYLPATIFMITVLSVYIMAQKHGFGLEAAFFTSLMLTTVGILGPAFLVPMSLGLPFIPLSLYLAFNFRTFWSYLALLIFVSFLLAIHAPTAIGLGIILTPYILLNLSGNFKHSLWLTLALALPFLVPFPWVVQLLLPTAKSLISPQEIPTYIDIPLIIKTYGYLPVSFCLLGTLWLTIKGNKVNYSLVFGLLALLMMLMIYFTFRYGVEIMYFRGLTYMMLMMSIVAGAGLSGVRNLKLPASVKIPFITQNVGNILALIIVVVTLVIAIPTRQDIPYYHMIDKKDYEAFTWIKDNVEESRQKAILDPWKATAFAAIAEREVYSRIHTAPDTKSGKAYDFLEKGCIDTKFLKENKISIVYSRKKCDNPDLLEVKDNIYLLKENQ